jgi:hypothetical protein
MASFSSSASMSDKPPLQSIWREEGDRRPLLRSYTTYYNAARTHLSVSKDAPSPRTVHAVGRILPRTKVGRLPVVCCWRTLALASARAFADGAPGRMRPLMQPRPPVDSRFPWRQPGELGWLRRSPSRSWARPSHSRISGRRAVGTAAQKLVDGGHKAMAVRCDASDDAQGCVRLGPDDRERRPASYRIGETRRLAQRQLASRRLEFYSCSAATKDCHSPRDGSCGEDRDACFGNPSGRRSLASPRD